MDDATTKLGLLMEAAQANQRAADASLRKLRLASGELTVAVRDEVRRMMLEELQSLSAETLRASDALRAIGHAANLRVLIWSVVITLVSAAIPLALGAWLLPSRSEVAALRAHHDALVNRIASLQEQGGRIDLRRCGSAGARLCVRVDRKAPVYGEQADYLVVRGY